MERGEVPLSRWAKLGERSGPSRNSELKLVDRPRDRYFRRYFQRSLGGVPRWWCAYAD
jgi:hypothetical protein